MSRPPTEKVTLDDVLITQELSRRSAREPNWQAESEALRSLTRQLVHEPEVMLQSLVDWAVELCDANAAGVSLVEKNPDGEEVFRWVALSGTLADRVGGCTPYSFSPCGVCLGQKVPLLFCHPERYFTYFQELGMPLVEGLVLPLLAEGQALGTIWVITQNEQRQFDPEDVRLMTGLAGFAAAALLRNQRYTQDLLATNAQLEAEVVERQLAEERALALIENLPGGAVFIVDRDLRYRLVQGEALSAAGFAPQDLVGQTIFAVLPPTLAASYEPLYRQALAGKPFAHEHQSHNRWYISRGAPLYDDNAEIYAVLAVSYDITDRKRAEEKLRRTAAMDAFRVKLSDGVRSLPDATEIQAAACRLLGEHLNVDRTYYVEVNEAEGYAHIKRDYVHGNSPSLAGFFPLKEYGWAVPYLRRGKTLTVTDVATAAIVPDRDRELMAALQIRAHISLPIVKAGKLVGALCVTDCTPREWTAADVELVGETAERIWSTIQQAHAEAALRESEQRLSVIFAQAAVGLSEISLDGHFEQVNDALCRMLGRSRQELLATTVAAVTHPEDAAKSTDALAQLLATGESISLDLRYRRPDDTLLWANSILTRLDDQQGQPQHILSVTVDLNDHKQAEADRIQLIHEQSARREAERASRMKDEFLSMVSHELQSPLVAILGWTRLLRADLPAPQNLPRKLEIIERSATLQAKLIKDLLDISRILVNKLSLSLHPIELAPIIESAIAILRPKAVEKGIQIDFRWTNLAVGLTEDSLQPPGENQNQKIFVMGDSDRLQQVFGNILTNAVKFTPECGQVTVALAPIEVNNQRYAEVRVTDTGIGIDPDFLTQVFERFMQAEKSGSAGGLGLGLAIARHLVELHHGEIEAASPGIGLGATFSIRLPLVEVGDD